MTQGNTEQHSQETADGVIIDLATPRPEEPDYKLANYTAFFVKELDGVVRVKVEAEDDDLEETGKLTANEQRDLERCERVIVKNRESFYQFALALEEIKRRKLFRGRFKSFAKYCQSVHGLGQAYAYRYARWGRKILENSPTGEKVPENEHQARKMIAAEKAKKRKTQVPQQGIAPLPAIQAEEVTEAVEEPASAEDGEAEAQEVEVTESPRKIVPLDRPAHLATYTEMYERCCHAYNIFHDGELMKECLGAITSLRADLLAYREWEKSCRQEAA